MHIWIFSHLKITNVTYIVHIRNTYNDKGCIIENYIFFYRSFLSPAFLYFCFFFVVLAIYLIFRASLDWEESILDFPFFFIISRTALLPFIAQPLFRARRLMPLSPCKLRNSPILIMPAKQRWQPLETNSHRGHNIVDINE